MSPDEIKNILDQHAMWLVDNATGKRADLPRADLSGANLTGATIAYGWKVVRA